MPDPADPSVMWLAEAVLKAACDQEIKLATAESCTGGLLSALLTEVEGVSHAFERGFVVYTDEAKSELLDVDASVLERCTAVSGPCAQQMAEDALAHSRADVAVSITGYADAAEDEANAGLVYFGLAVRGSAPRQTSARFAGDTRARVRLASLRMALQLLQDGVAMAAQQKRLGMPRPR